MIENSVPRITDWHHEACRVMTNGDPERRIFLSHPHTNIGFFFLLTAYTAFYIGDHIKDFQKILNSLKCDMVTSFDAIWSCFIAQPSYCNLQTKFQERQSKGDNFDRVPETDQRAPLRGSVLPWSLKIMHWSPQIPANNFLVSLKVFAFAPQIPKNSSVSPKIPQNISQFTLQCFFIFPQD